MTLETETVLDRRRLRRNIAGWRALAVLALVMAVGALLLRGETTTGIGPHQIARVSFEGTITENREQLKMLKKIKDAANVDGVIVFVNSPGGTTTGGEAIYEALRDVASKKPVVAQFGTIAASAGYIIGLGCDHIVARGNTITGSVGVIVQWPEVSSLLDKLGVKMNEVKSGPLKASPSPFEPINEASREVLQKMIGDGFKWFLTLVEARRGLKPAEVDGLVQGRVFSGREALAARLVDELGGEAEAVRWMEAARGVKHGLKVVDWKPRKDSDWLQAPLTSAATNVLGEWAGAAVRSLNGEGAFVPGGLDGLVSVWHPSNN